MSLAQFGPFANVFEASGLPVPGYLVLLNLGGPEVQIVIDRVAKALSQGNSQKWIDALFDDVNWRPHLVGAIAMILNERSSFSCASLWRAIDRGSWVIPQLVVTGFYADPTFVEQCRTRIDTAGPISVPQGLSPIERHSATGPAGVSARSSKLLASLVAVGRRIPSMESWLEQACLRSEIQELIKQDIDNSASITSEWLESVTESFAERGRKLSPKAF